ncbi:MAG: cell division protein ZapA [Bdellovibrionales bacterium]|jgi:cell division protein ZapA|nr:cell division protein ZapA [Bdellovibrionales bacterium]
MVPMAGLTSTSKARLLEAARGLNREVTEGVRKGDVAPGSSGHARSGTVTSGGVSGGVSDKTSGTSAGGMSYQVSIAGVPLRLKSSHDKETVNELVRMVDDKIQQAMPLTKTGSIQNASILAALNMAEELLILKRRALELVEGLEARAARVIEDLEKSGPTA